MEATSGHWARGGGVIRGGGGEAGGTDREKLYKSIRYFGFRQLSLYNSTVAQLHHNEAVTEEYSKHYEVEYDQHTQHVHVPQDGFHIADCVYARSTIPQTTDHFLPPIAHLVRDTALVYPLKNDAEFNIALCLPGIPGSQRNSVSR